MYAIGPATPLLSSLLSSLLVLLALFSILIWISILPSVPWAYPRMLPPFALVSCSPAPPCSHHMWTSMSLSLIVAISNNLCLIRISSMRHIFLVVRHLVHQWCTTDQCPPASGSASPFKPPLVCFAFNNLYFTRTLSFLRELFMMKKRKKRKSRAVHAHRPRSLSAV